MGSALLLAATSGDPVPDHEQDHDGQRHGRPYACKTSDDESSVQSSEHEQRKAKSPERRKNARRFSSCANGAQHEGRDTKDPDKPENEPREEGGVVS
jgi:hypothetical protein